MTLIEMLIGTAITLMLMFAVVQVFQMLGDNIRSSRAVIEMSGQMRAVAHRLQADLDGVTVPVRPAAETDTPGGYFMYVEGPRSDWADESGTPWANKGGQRNSALGDIDDDYIAFTARSKGEPFIGMVGNKMYESQMAEIVWWSHWEDRPNSGVKGLCEVGEVNLYRWVLLIRPDLTGAQATDDISIGENGPNTVDALTRHENRVTLQRINSLENQPNALAERLILSDVLAFDVRAFDPQARLEIRTISNSRQVALTPGDNGYPKQMPTGNGPRGAYVDLNYAKNNGTFFSGAGDPEPDVNAKYSFFKLGYPTYDTWSFHYEFTEGGGEAVDGLDNGDGITGIVDDPGERVSRAPYPVPLRGIQATVRKMEFTTRQVRQVSVVSNFVPD